jgi:hypothetical protein
VSLTLDPEVAATLQAMAEHNGPLPAPPPIGDVDSRRAGLNAMLAWANNAAQPIAEKVEIVDHEVIAADGTKLLARWYRLPGSDSRRYDPDEIIVGALDPHLTPNEPFDPGHHEMA